MEEIFGLIDCNNFYVSCERVFRPDLEGVPVIVLSTTMAAAAKSLSQKCTWLPDTIERLALAAPIPTDFCPSAC